MKQCLLFLLALTGLSVSYAQNVPNNQKLKNEHKPKFGLKAGYNISYVNGSNRLPRQQQRIHGWSLYGSTGKA
jgi:hypothetical protein